MKCTVTPVNIKLYLKFDSVKKITSKDLLLFKMTKILLIMTCLDINKKMGT